MKTAKPSDAAAQVEAAIEVAQSGLINAALDQSERVLDRLIADYRSQKMTDRDAAVGVAVIAELRSIYSRAERVLQRGAAADEQLNSTARTQ